MNVVLITLLICLIVTFCSKSLIAQPPGPLGRAAGPLSVNPVKKNIYEVKGGICNTGFFVTDNEVIAIDAEMTPESGKEMMDKIKQITDKPINHMILTHSDGDHINGLPAWPRGINLIAHINIKRDMEQGPLSDMLKRHLPDQVFSDRMTVESGDMKIELLYFGPAHTDGDTVVYCPEAKLAFIGDLVFFDREPLVKEKGNSFGIVKALKGILELDADTFIHGHGAVIGRGEIEQYIERMEERQTKIRELIEQNKSLSEIKQIFYPDGEPKQRPMRGPMRGSLVEIIYNEIINKNNRITEG